MSQDLITLSSSPINSDEQGGIRFDVAGKPTSERVIVVEDNEKIFIVEGDTKTILSQGIGGIPTLSSEHNEIVQFKADKLLTASDEIISLARLDNFALGKDKLDFSYFADDIKDSKLEISNIRLMEGGGGSPDLGPVINTMKGVQIWLNKKFVFELYFTAENVLLENTLSDHFQFTDRTANPDLLKLLGLEEFIPAAVQKISVKATSDNDEVLAGYKDPDGNSITAENNNVWTGDGNDVVDLRGQNYDWTTTVLAGAGDDVVKSDNSKLVVELGSGNDQIYASGTDDKISGGSGHDVIHGEDGDDRIYGGAGNDTIYGGDGKDTIVGGSGHDFINAGNGDDIIRDGAGNDTIHAGSGNDAVALEFGSDTVDLGEGDDSITVSGLVKTAGNIQSHVTGGAGDDTLYGWSRNENITVTFEGDKKGVLVKETGDISATISFSDIEKVNLGWMRFYGSSRTIKLTPNSGSNEFINFTLRTDKIDLSAIKNSNGDPLSIDDITIEKTKVDDWNNNYLITVTDNVQLKLTNANLTQITRDKMDKEVFKDIIITDAQKTDGVVQGTDGDDVIETGYTDAQGDLVSDKAESIWSGAGNDKIVSGGGDDKIAGATGNDEIFAGEGDDQVWGEAGNDMIVGGTGSDRLFGGAGDDEIRIDLSREGAGKDYVEGGEGSDVLNLSQTKTATTLTFDGANKGYVQSGDAEVNFNTIETVKLGAGVDTVKLNAKAGANMIEGFKLGVDKLDVSGLTDADGKEVNTADATVTKADNGDYTVTFPGGEAITFKASDTSGVENADKLTTEQLLELHGIPAVPKPDGVVQGTDGDDVIETGYTDAQGDLVSDKAESIWSGAGNDKIVSGGGDDKISGAAGNDEIFAGEGDDQVWGEAGNDMIVGGTGSDRLHGGAGDDEIRTDLSREGAGKDYVEGGEGSDVLNLSQTKTATTLTFDGANKGYVQSGDAEVNFNTIETVKLGAGVDTVKLNAKAGANMIEGFKLGVDKLDVSGLTDADGKEVNTADATVTKADNGDYTVTFPGGEAITFKAPDTSGVANADKLTTEQLLEMAGIPAPKPDGVVQGTSGDDLIENAYVDDDGDQIGNGNDSIWAGAGNDKVVGGGGDDKIAGAAGNDEIFAGEGDDQVWGEAGNDMIIGGTGSDYLDGGAGDDEIRIDLGREGAGQDYVVGGSGRDTLNLSETKTATKLTFDGANKGYVSGGEDDSASQVNFKSMETVELGEGADTVKLLAGSGLNTVEGFKLGTDKLDISSLKADDDGPVDTSDVKISFDGSGSPLLGFPGSVSLKLQGLEAKDLTSSDVAVVQKALSSLGIPTPEQVERDAVEGVEASDGVEGVLMSADAPNISNSEEDEAENASDASDFGADLMFGAALLGGTLLASGLLS